MDARLVKSAALLTDNGYTSSLLRYQSILIQLITPQADAIAHRTNVAALEGFSYV